MRYGLEVNPFLDTDLVDKWEFQNAENATIEKYDIVLLDEADGRMGVKRAQAGVNVTAPTPLFFAGQELAPNERRQRFFRTGKIPADTLGNTTGPVYLSATTPGKLVYTAPANPIVVGQIVDEDVVFLDLGGGGGAGASKHLPETTYWVNEAGDRDARQFDTVAEAITQATADLAAGTAITIQGDGATSIGASGQNIPSTHPVVFRDCVLSMVNWVLTADAEVYFYNCVLAGSPDANNSAYVYLQDCVFASSGWVLGVRTLLNSTTPYIEFQNCVGSPFITQDDTLANTGMDIVMSGCQFQYDATVPSFMHFERGTLTMTNCTVTGTTNAEPPIKTDIKPGFTGTITLNECIFTYQTGKSDSLIEDLGAVAPTVTIEGGRYKMAALGPGVTYTTNSLPYMDIGNRSGAAAAQNLAGSLRPTYECGRSVTSFSPAVGVLFGHQECLEFSFTTAVDDTGRDGTNVASGATDVVMPDGETWYVICYRVIRNGGLIHADQRPFTLVRSAGTVTVATGTTTNDIGAAVGAVTIVSGATTGSFKVVSSSNTGYDDRVTLVVKTALDKAAF